MSKIPESSVVTLYSGVDITTGLQIIFSNPEHQAAYFATKKKFGDIMARKKFSYLRRGGTLKLELPTIDVAQCDYMSFRNPAFENKEFYAKIVNYEYISNKVTLITYAIDDFQTYMFDVNYEWGVIEREHLSQADFEKAEENPFDRSIFEFQTAETLAVSKEMEIIYTEDASDNMDNEGGISRYPIRYDSSCVIMEIAEFDTSEFPNIQTDFYNYFDTAIAADGTILKGSPGILAMQAVARGYGLYEIALKGTTTSNTGAERFQSALQWLTYQGLTGQIIGVFQCNLDMWHEYIFSSTSPDAISILYSAKVKPRKYDVSNKKLLLFPYQYFRVYNNEGDCKEYKYELFDDVVAGNEAKLIYLSLFDGTPITSLIPDKYRRSGWNQEERIDCHQIPQVGYCTDAYLAFVASQMQMNIGSRTNTVKEGIQSKTKEILDAYAAEDKEYHSFGEAMDAAGWEGFRDFFVQDLQRGIQRFSGAENDIKNTLTGIGTGNFGQVASSFGNLPMANLRGETNTWRSGNNYPSTGMLAPAKAAFAADDYHPGSNNGVLGYYLDTPMSPGTFTIIRVKLLDSVLRTYDEYFSGYGYTSGRIGKPRVCDYIKGNIENVPHFSDYQGKNLTYVKTNNMHVNHTLASVAANIESMFNTGCQFLKGEDLYEQ